MRRIPVTVNLRIIGGSYANRSIHYTPNVPVHITEVFIPQAPLWAPFDVNELVGREAYAEIITEKILGCVESKVVRIFS